MNAELAFFYVAALGLVLSALGMVLARNLVHGVLLMVANFVLTALLYLLLDAPFIAAVQLIVYAGAIMVLFLFVVMLLGNQDLSLRDAAGGRRSVAVALLLVLGSLLTFVSKEGLPVGQPDGLARQALPVLGDLAKRGAQDPQAAAGYGSPQMVGELLYRSPYHLPPFELVSLLLTVAMMGAVVIARFGARSGPVPAEGGGDSTAEGEA